MKKYTSYIVVVCVALCLVNKSTFAEVPEHPVIKPIPKSILEKSSEQKNYTYEFPFYDKSVDVISYKKINGTYRKWSYRIFGKEAQKVDGIFSSIEIIRGYRDFAVKKGGEILWEQGNGGRLSFMIPKPDGDKTWCHVSARNGYYELDIVEKESVKKKVSPSTGKMKKELDIKGRITIYSILFDFDKYDSKKESEKPLQEIADLLLDYPGLKIEIQGHTDNQGQDDYNLTLSQKRAENVRLYLIGLGVDSLRLTARGYGAAMPVAANNTREGRAKNRRVVLVERDEGLGKVIPEATP